MIDIREVVTALRLRRHFLLIKSNIHPLSNLLKKLMLSTGYLGSAPCLDIEEIVACNMKVLSNKRKNDCNIPDWLIETDLVLHSNLANANIWDLTRPRKRQGQELRQLRRRGMNTFSDVLQNARQNLATLLKISDKRVTSALAIMGRIYGNTQLPEPVPGALAKIKDKMGRWSDDTTLNSRALREILFDQYEGSPKIALMGDDIKFPYFHKLSKVINVKNKSRMLRLLYGDVYCAERTFRFGLSDNNQCKRCFETETISHLLMDCPYTRRVYTLLGLNTLEINDILGIYLGRGELEIRADLLGFLVFGQRTLPPEVLVNTTLEKYAKGLTEAGGAKKAAVAKLRLIRP
jgi:hypothetical protein